MKKYLGILFLIVLLIWSAACQQVTPTTYLVPLDSRPCNTSESALFAQIGHIRLEYPSDGLDDFLTPADTEQLWQWLESRPSRGSSYLLFTNSLYNGGLIASRHPDSYADQTAQTERLRRFLETQRDRDVTVITVLPRHLPSQYEPTLAPYSMALAAWGSALDQADVSGNPLPPAPADVPAESAARYLQLFQESDTLVRALIPLTEEGLIDTYVIALDDNVPFCLGRRMLRQLPSTASHVQIVNGADELTMMLLAKNATEQPLSVTYSDPQQATTIPTYEGQTLATTVAEKMSFLGFVSSDATATQLLIHNAAVSISAEPSAIADVAVTNRGDAALYPYLTAHRTTLQAYSGWNTASNSIGTAMATLKIAQGDFDRSALQQFVQLRIAVDQVYLAILAPELIPQWRTQGFIDGYGAFTSANARSECETQLNAAFAPYADALQCKSDARLIFPWARTFEVTLTNY